MDHPSAEIDKLMIDAIDEYKEHTGGAVPSPEILVNIELRAIRNVMNQMYEKLLFLDENHDPKPLN